MSEWGEKQTKKVTKIVCLLTEENLCGGVEVHSPDTRQSATTVLSLQMYITCFEFYGFLIWE